MQPAVIPFPLDALGRPPRESRLSRSLPSLLHSLSLAEHDGGRPSPQHLSTIWAAFRSNPFKIRTRQAEPAAADYC